MPRLILILSVLLLTLLVGNPAVSADFHKGRDALKRGDYATALKEFTPLAEQGNARAQSNLDEMYYRGQGVQKDDKIAAKLYKLAVKQGDASAQFNLVWMYYHGQGVPKDYSTAIKWYKLAAEHGGANEQGFADAQRMLGLMYDMGMGAIQDYVYAHMWYNIAASFGDKIAIDARNIVAKTMTPSQIETAQRLARECVEKNYKGC